jgi:hypothetical protein
MSNTINGLEAVLIEAHRVKGWKWVVEEPLWVTWSLEKFGKYPFPFPCGRQMQTNSSDNQFLFLVHPVTRIPAILPRYHRSLALHVELVDGLRSHSVSFEDSRDAINEWVQQSWLANGGWNAAWEDLCEVEIEKWR